MDISVPGVTFLDRRIAAADEYRTRDRRAIYMPHITRGPRTDEHPRGEVLPTPRRRNFDVRTTHPRTGLPASGRRSPAAINKIILHKMGPMEAAPFPATSDPARFDQDDHRLDVIIAHFIVRSNGVIAYTHDVEHILNGTGALRDSIEIEFEGNYNIGTGPHPRDPRVLPVVILAGRLLVTSLVRNSVLPIRTIHPHQQFSPRTRPNDPGPDLWVNIGEWAVNQFNLETTFRRNRISDDMSNQAYRQ